MAQGVLEAILPSHCHRTEFRLSLCVYPSVVLLLQAILLLHTRHHATPSSSSSSWRLWLWRKNHAQPIRALLLALLIPLVLRMAFSQMLQERLLPGTEGHPVKANMYNYILGIGGFVMMGKGIEFACLARPPRLSYSDAQHKASKRASDEEDQALPLCYPHTWVPLAIDVIFNFHGYGWDWTSRRASRAGYATKSPPTTYRDPRSVRFLVSRVLRGSFCLSIYCIDCFLIQQPRVLAAFDFPPGTHSSRNEPYAESKLTTTLARGLLALTTGGIGIFAMLQGYFILGSLIHFALDPRAQIYWDTLPFGNPLASTSLHRAWGREWHGVMRRVWYFNGYLPVYYLSFNILKLGRSISQTLAITALFTLSGLFHEIGLFSMRQGVDGPHAPNESYKYENRPCPPLDPVRSGFGANGFITLRFFLLQALGLLFEDLFRQVTGRRVRGVWGWLWTLMWLTYWCGDVYKVSYEDATIPDVLALND